MPRLINSLLAVALLVTLVALPVGDAPTRGDLPPAGLAAPGGGSVAYAQGSLPAIPSSWPSNLRSLQIGRASVPDEASGMMASAPFAFRYQYLAGGVNTASNWANWNPDGAFATNYIQDSVSNNVVPAFTYYMIYQSAPANGAGNEAAAIRGNLNNTSTMQAYYANLKLFFQRAGAFPSNKVVFHVEPDMWGYIQQDATSDNAATVSVKVGSTGVSDVAGLPDTAAGLAKAIVRLRNLYGPNVILAYHASDWGTGTDIALQEPNNSQVDLLGDRAAAFYNSLGADFDLAFSEISDRDSGFDQVKYGMGPEAWWTDADFTRHARFIGRFVQGSGKRIVLWQIPLGNTKMRAMNNTDFHFQDNRVEKLLDEPSRARLQTYINAGVMAFLFGAGEYYATHPTDHQGTGVTNPTAINGNIIDSYNADDDGGFFHNRVAAYYTTGAMSIPGGSSSPATPTPTRTPTRTATPNPGGATPTPTATLPPVACSPRPAVSVDTTPSGNSLRVDLAASGQNNRLLTLQFTKTTNALVDVGGQTGRTGLFSVNLPGNTTSTSFYVRRATAGAATAMLTVVDRCGSWSTFVGGGPGSGF